MDILWPEKRHKTSWRHTVALACIFNTAANRLSVSFTKWFAAFQQELAMKLLQEVIFLIVFFLQNPHLLQTFVKKLNLEITLKYLFTLFQVYWQCWLNEYYTKRERRQQWQSVSKDTSGVKVAQNQDFYNAACLADTKW